MLRLCEVRIKRRGVVCLAVCQAFFTGQMCRTTADEVSPLSAAATVSNNSATCSFENCPAGKFTQITTPVGQWTAQSGLAVIDDRHAYTGRHCLQLTGGEKTVVMLKISDRANTGGTLSFRAERWTSRTPFRFRIEKRSADQWSEIYNGDNKVRVGRSFLNEVRVPLRDPNITHLRFTCSSPPDTGILLDDIRIGPETRQRVTSVRAVPFTLPALVGAPSSPLAKLSVTTEGTLHPLNLTGIRVQLISPGNPSPVSEVFISRRPGGPPDAGTAIQPASDWMSSDVRTVQTSTLLSEGENIVWINARLKPDVDIDAAIGAVVTELTVDGRTVDVPPHTASTQRMGIALRQHGDDGVHTYRIPGLATTRRGTLIGVYDVRHRSGGDLPGDIDVGMSRSTDGGRTWEPMKIIMDMGNDPKWHYDGVGDPAVLVDRSTGTIFVAATWSHGNRSWRGSGPGLLPHETGQLMLVRSDDDGQTWSAPINITSQVKHPDWCFLLQGPGRGITMSDGTIVFAAQYQDPPENNRLPHSTILYSKDHGATWQIGTGAFDDTTESQVAEIEPGVLMLNCRYNRKPARVVMTTRDLGRTWQKHPTSERALIEPRACMASMIRVDPEGDSEPRTWLLFSNPNSTVQRERLTIKASPDLGMTWPAEFQILLDEGRSAGYSCLSMIDGHTVGILYEGSQAQLTFQRIPLRNVIGHRAAVESQP